MDQHCTLLRQTVSAHLSNWSYFIARILTQESWVTCILADGKCKLGSDLIPVRQKSSEEIFCCYFYLFLIGGWLLYNALVSAVQQWWASYKYTYIPRLFKNIFCLIGGKLPYNFVLVSVVEQWGISHSFVYISLSSWASFPSPDPSP